MKFSSSLLVILGAVALANCEVFFEEKFSDGKQKCIVGLKPVTMKTIDYFLI